MSMFLMTHKAHDTTATTSSSAETTATTSLLEPLVLVVNFGSLGVIIGHHEGFAARY